MKAKLTTRNIKLLKPKAKAYEVVDTDIKGFLLRIQPTGVMAYYYAYRNHEHKKVRYRIGGGKTLTVAQAREIAEGLAVQIAMGLDVQASKSKAIAKNKKIITNTLGHFIEKHYAPWIKPIQKSSLRTLQALHTDFKTFYHLPLQELTVLKLEKWRANLMQQGLKPSTINRKLARLRSLLTNVIEWNIIETHFLQTLKRSPEDDNLMTCFLSEAEEQRLRRYLRQRDLDKRQQRKTNNQ